MNAIPTAAAPQDSAARTIEITSLQAEHVSWALDPMMDYWGADNGKPTRAGEIFSDAGDPSLVIPEGATMPTLNGLLLTLSTWSEINDDLHYRVGTQLPAMMDDNHDWSPQKLLTQKRSCEVLADKIGGAA